MSMTVLLRQLEEIVKFKNRFTEKRGIEEFVLCFGERDWVNEPFTDEEKEFLSPMLNYSERFFLNNHAFSNSLFLYDHLVDEGFEVKYYEGYAMNEEVKIPFFHSWVTVEGKIIDLTWVDYENNKEDIRRILYGNNEYYLNENVYIGVEIKQDHIDEYRDSYSGSFLEDHGNGYPLLLNYRKNIRLCL